MDEEEAILSGLLDWVSEILPTNFTHEIINNHENDKHLMIFQGDEGCIRIGIGDNGVEMMGKVIAWTRSDIQREFQRMILVSISRMDPTAMLNNPKFMKAWQHIMTQDVS